jgi:Bacterial PH domain
VTVFAGLVITLMGSRRATFEVGDGKLRFRGDLYGSPTAISDLRLEEARILDLTQEPELRPRLRTAGTALPGYSAGWFRLKNGEKALLYVTRKERVVYIPTRLGHAILLSPEQPEQLLAALRAAGP